MGSEPTYIVRHAGEHDVWFEFYRRVPPDGCVVTTWSADIADAMEFDLLGALSVAEQVGGVVELA